MPQVSGHPVYLESNSQLMQDFLIISIDNRLYKVKKKVYSPINELVMAINMCFSVLIHKGTCQSLQTCGLVYSHIRKLVNGYRHVFWLFSTCIHVSVILWNQVHIVESDTLKVKQSHCFSEGSIHDAPFVECVIAKLKQIILYYLMDMRQQQKNSKNLNSRKRKRCDLTYIDNKNLNSSKRKRCDLTQLQGLSTHYFYIVLYSLFHYINNTNVMNVLNTYIL